MENQPKYGLSTILIVISMLVFALAAFFGYDDQFRHAVYALSIGGIINGSAHFIA